MIKPQRRPGQFQHRSGHPRFGSDSEDRARFTAITYPDKRLAEFDGPYKLADYHPDGSAVTQSGRENRAGSGG